MLCAIEPILQRFRFFYLAYPSDEIYATASRKTLAALLTEKSAALSRISGGKPIRQTLSDESGTVILQTPSAKFTLAQIAACFPLHWSAYLRLLAVKNGHARSFYETEFNSSLAPIRCTITIQ